MNIEEQSLDLCNVKTISNADNDHNTTNNTEEVTCRISELTTDSNSEKQIIVPTEASETYLMPHLTDNLQAEEDNHLAKDTLEIDEVNGNGKSSEQDSPALANATQHKDSNGVQILKEAKGNDPAHIVVGEGNDGAEMDIGVDLSLDESGVLEADTTTDISSTDNTLGLDLMSQGVLAISSAERPSDASQTSNTETTATDQAGLYPLVEDEDGKHKPSGKRVTFPSDDDIVSGAVEPKDPWRHGNIFSISIYVNGFLLIVLVCCVLTCMIVSVKHGSLWFIFLPRISFKSEKQFSHLTRVTFLTPVQSVKGSAHGRQNGNVQGVMLYWSVRGIIFVCLQSSSLNGSRDSI